MCFSMSFQVSNWRYDTRDSLEEQEPFVYKPLALISWIFLFLQRRLLQQSRKGRGKAKQRNEQANKRKTSGWQVSCSPWLVEQDIDIKLQLLPPFPPAPPLCEEKMLKTSGLIYPDTLTDSRQLQILPTKPTSSTCHQAADGRERRGETPSPLLAVHIKPNPPPKSRQAAFVQVADAAARVCFKQGHAISPLLCACLCSFLLMQESGDVLEHTCSAQSDHCQLNYSSISPGWLAPKGERRLQGEK